VLDAGALALGAAIRRELSVPISSLTGSGEQLSINWRFWADRPLYQVSFSTPAPWRGVMSLTASREAQPYSATLARTIHDSVSFEVADWATRSLRWQFGAGSDRWDGMRALATASGGLRFASSDDRLDAQARMQAWFAEAHAFQTGQAILIARSSARREGTVIVATGGVHAVTASAPADLWFAGDTGRARPIMLRAHPILTQGERFRIERLGRLVGNGSAEVQRWWTAGVSHIGAAMFVDTARTARRLAGTPLTDIDVGVGFRAAYPGRSGALSVNLARGLRDGETALSVVYAP